MVQLVLLLGWVATGHRSAGYEQQQTPKINTNRNGTTRYGRWFCNSKDQLRHPLPQVERQHQPQQRHPLPQVVLLDCWAVAESVPLAYLITFRSYGTWLHGDPRGSVDRFHNQYGEPVFPPNAARLGQTEVRLKRVPVVLTEVQRQSVERAIRETE